MSPKLPGPESLRLLARAREFGAPMGKRASESEPPFGIVYASADGNTVVDVDGGRYLDFAAGFGSLLLGHNPKEVLEVLSSQSRALSQALGDVYASDVKVALLERLAGLYPEPGARVLLGQSGADAVSAALKTAVLYTGRHGVLAFNGAYHGLSYGPLAACGLREGYRAPFSRQLNPHVTFVDYPADEAALEGVLEQASRALRAEQIGAVLVEPVLGRGGCVVPPAGFLPELARLAHRHGALLIADEIWTGLGRSGAWLRSVADGARPDLVCLGKGLGGILPLSACIGSGGVMAAWSRDPEVVHTSTFAGAPLSAATALATLKAISERGLVERSQRLGRWFLERLQDLSARRAGLSARGSGLMLGLEIAAREGGAVRVLRELLERGYIATSGGGARDVLVMTPPLTIEQAEIEGLLAALEDCLQA